ncbi:MAG: molybdopterin cofactor-binding domain-containing protein [Myxococcota bacterium]
MSGLPVGLERYPEIDTWVRIDPDGKVCLRTGKVEIGQGIRAALARIAAEELDVALESVTVLSAETDRGPNELYTAGSMSMETSGAAIRQVAAEARLALLELAAPQLGASLEELEVEDGRIRARGTGLETTYRELMGGKEFRRRVTGRAVPKDPAGYRIVGKPGPRLDLEGKLLGEGFVHDLELPGMLHGRVVRPPSYGASLQSVDEEDVRRIPGVVEVVRDGSFLGVCAEREEQAVRAADRLRQSARWHEPATLPAQSDLENFLRTEPAQSFPIVDGRGQELEVPPIEEPPGVATTLEATYFRPYHMHGSIGPSAAVARFEAGRLTVWTHSQGIHLLRLSLAQVLGAEPDTVRVLHRDGAGCYGHNGADDAALDATLLARAVPDRAVRLQWSREDEHTWEPYGPAMVVRLRASLDAASQVVDWNHDVWSNTHMGRPLPYGNASGLVAAWHLDEPKPRPEPRADLGFHSGSHRNADPLYGFPRRRIVKHLVWNAPLRVSSTRGLGAYANVFAIESFMDELADAAGIDPLTFRLAALEDPRARAVLEAAAERAGWRAEVGRGRGQGLAFARYENSKCYTAIVVDLEVDASSHSIRLLRAVIAADAGQIVDPQGLSSQLEGGFVQSASWTLKEEVCFDRTRVTSTDWEGYPILTFTEVPPVETVLIDRPGEPYLGSGEASQGPTPAAIANALFHATGLRLRRIPFTNERIGSALAAGQETRSCL